MDAREEHLNHDEQRVADLIGNLRRVDAPRDFDARVRARIAVGRDGLPRSSWRPVLVGVAAVAVLAFAGYLGLRSFDSGDVSPARDTANTRTIPPPREEGQKPVVQSLAPIATQENAPAVATTKQTIANGNTMPVRPAGGSIDEASKDMHRPFSKDYAPSDNSGLATAEISIAMILDGIGVHASWAETGWRVDSLISNSVGARTGIRPGDIIESLDGQMLSEKTSFKGAFSGKSIRVRRDGALIDLAFKP